MEAALQTERTALREQGGVTDGTIAANVKPSTPRAPADVRPARITSRDPHDFPAVTGREEEWRFTPINRIRMLLEREPSDAQLQWKTELPEGVSVREAAADDPIVSTVPDPVDRISALAMQRAGNATVISIPAEARLTEPVLLDLRGTGGDEIVWSHLVIDIGAFAEATIVLEHAGDARYAACVSVLVGDGAKVDIVSVQEWDSTAVHGGHTAIRVGRDATVRGIDVTLGGD